MPTYAYACTECEHKFDAVQSFADDALTDCPQCSGRLRKLFSAVGIVFKGSGFYRTDSRNGGRPASKDSPAKSADSADGTGSAKDSAKDKGSTGSDANASTGSASKSASSANSTSSQTSTTTSAKTAS